MNTIEAWNKIFSEGKSFSPLSELLLADIIIKTGIESGKVLDIGCGSGETALIFTDKGFDYTGVDISDVAIKLATEKVNKPTAKFIQGDINSLNDIVKGEFDLIIIKLVIAFVYDRKKFLNQVKSLLSNKGFVVLITPVLLPQVTDYSPRLMKISVKKDELEDELSETFTDITPLHKSYFEKNGLEITYLLK